MKPFALVGLLAVCLLATTAVSQEAKKDDLKYQMDDLEATYGLKLKGAKLRQEKSGGDTHLTMTLEFGKDLTTEVFLKANVRELFAGNKAGSGMVLMCYFIDEDGVAVGKQPPGKIEGEVTGKLGDAFRITQIVPAELLAKTKKISYREEPAK